jgi:hypothetical protein
MNGKYDKLRRSKKQKKREILLRKSQKQKRWGAQRN